MNSTDQVARLLALVPYLQAHGDSDVSSTAALFGVTPKQLVADLNVLWYCGLPGGMPGDLIEVDMDALAGGTIRLTNADFLARPLRFTLDEAMSLVVALRALQEMGDSSLQGAVASALAKLDAVVGSATPRVGVQLAAGAEEVREALLDAVARGLAVQLEYDGPSRPQPTHPRVDPARITVRDGYTYLDAWSHDRGAWRTYRLDRIADVNVTDKPVGDHGPAPAFTAGWLDERPDAAEVTLTLSAEGRWITEYVPTRRVEETDAGARVTLLVADPAWLRRMLLRLGPAVLAVEPPQAAESARDAAREALDLY